MQVPSREQLGSLAREFGFSALGVADIALDEDEQRLQAWLAAGFHGEMGFLAEQSRLRTHPAELIPGTLRVISLAMDYWPAEARAADGVLADADLAYISRYALGRDYHKIVRQNLARFAEALRGLAPHQYRVFVDSGPVMEKPLARNAGLGWIGKHTNLIAREAGSYFFIGEVFTDLPLPVDEPASGHCGTCSACLPACPTQAIIAPYQLDARRCISYLTIELKGPIPEALRPAIGNRIYGCDDCQLVCPWNKFARTAAHPDFRVRHGLDAPRLAELLGWDEAEFLRRTEGSALRRISHERFLRNVAVALGNASPTAENLAALAARRDDASPLVREHVLWAIAQLEARARGGDASGG